MISFITGILFTSSATIFSANPVVVLLTLHRMLINTVYLCSFRPNFHCRTGSFTA